MRRWEDREDPLGKTEREGRQEGRRKRPSMAAKEMREVTQQPEAGITGLRKAGVTSSGDLEENGPTSRSLRWAPIK